jgi:hypothetical protein
LAHQQIPRILLFFAASLACILVLPALFQDGMFADGILYAAVSKNLADGLGSFWHPHFSELAMQHFHEQPPLVFFLQSFFFRLFNGIYPERVYCLALLVINFLLIRKTWKNISGDNTDLRGISAFPLILFFLSPVVFWSFTNNVIEITMSAFVLASVNSFHAALIQKRHFWLNVFLAIAWTIAATLCKGPQGVFAITWPAILWLTGKLPLKKALTVTLVASVAIAAFYCILLSLPSTRETFTSWYRNRIEATFSGSHATTGSHFHLLFELLLDMLMPLGLALIVLIAGRKAASDSGMIRWGHAFLLLALAGSLPLMVTSEQRGFYLFTSMPFYALATACYAAHAFVHVTTRVSQLKTVRISILALSAALLGIAATLTILKAGTPKRDADLLYDIRLTGELVGEHHAIVLDQSLYNNWAVSNYYERLFHIASSTNTEVMNSRYLISVSKDPREGWELQDVKLKSAYLFKKK